MSSSSSPWKNKKAQLLHNLWIDSPAFILILCLSFSPYKQLYIYMSVCLPTLLCLQLPEVSLNYVYNRQLFPFFMCTAISFSPFLCVQPSAFPLCYVYSHQLFPLLCLQSSAFPLCYVYSHQLFPFPFPFPFPFDDVCLVSFSFPFGFFAWKERYICQEKFDKSTYNLHLNKHLIQISKLYLIYIIIKLNGDEKVIKYNIYFWLQNHEKNHS